MPDSRPAGNDQNRDHCHSAGKVPQPLLLVLPVLMAVGILLMFFMGRTETDSKDLLLEELESRVKRLEQRLAKLEQPEPRGFQPREEVRERPSQAEKTRPEPQARPDPPEKTRGGAFHQVVEGDTLFKISRLYGVAVEDLRRWNNLPAGEGIRTGQRLRVSDLDGR